MEKLIKTIELFDRKINLHKQGMWLIASHGNEEIKRIELFGKSLEDGLIEIIHIITEQLTSTTFEANLLGYQKIMDRMDGQINLKRRQESFNDWKEILNENGTITDEQVKIFKYVGDEEMYQ